MPPDPTFADTVEEGSAEDVATVRAPLRPRFSWHSPLLGALCFAASSLLAYGFTVDDALISARVAHHLATGSGYRFNASGAVTDAVTPLGWAPLISPLCSQSVWSCLQGARWLGLVAALVSGAVTGWLLEGTRSARRAVLWPACTLCLPLGAWCASGMETPLILLLATLALLPGQVSLIAASLCAALRPEMVPWAMTLALLGQPEAPAPRRLLRLSLVLLGPLAVGLLRAWLFGSPAPLSAIAKPSDFSSGLAYVWGALRLMGLPVLWIAWKSWRGLSPRILAIALATAVHGAAIVVAGGDWMALFRLFVPIIPGLLIVAAELQARAPLPVGLLRSAAATAIAVALHFQLGTTSRQVWAQRRALVEQAQPLLVGDSVIASLDIGWLGASTSSTIVDLAGVTDPEVAFLPGGHTSKRLPQDFLRRREVESLVLLLAPGQEPTAILRGERDWRVARFARAVEAHVSRSPDAGLFKPVAALPLKGTEQHYLLLRKATEHLVRATR